MFKNKAISRLFFNAFDHNSISFTFRWLLQNLNDNNKARYWRAPKQHWFRITVQHVGRRIDAFITEALTVGKTLFQIHLLSLTSQAQPNSKETNFSYNWNSVTRTAFLRRGRLVALLLSQSHLLSSSQIAILWNKRSDSMLHSVLSYCIIWKLLQFHRHSNILEMTL